MQTREYVLRSIAIKRYPQEACALIFENGDVQEILNIAAESRSTFCMSPTMLLSAYLAHDNQKAAIWHSHTQKYFHFEIRTPSAEDIALYERTGCELLISGFDGVHYYETVSFPAKLNPNLSFLDRPYIAGIYDCGTLVRDVYNRVFDVSLTYKFYASYLHPKNWREAVRTFLQENNFKEISLSSRLRPGDILVVDRQGLPAAHGVMVWDEDLQILDQREKSCLVSIDSLETIRSIWRKL